MNCPECDGSEWAWYLADNEEGWKCLDCGHKPGEPPGYSPELDREEIGSKIYSILLELTQSHSTEPGFVYVSNGSMGDGIVAVTAAWCRETGHYDQASIAWKCIENCGAKSDFWREQGEAIRAGKDPRRRCNCGVLATVFTKDGAWCPEHPYSTLPFGEPEVEQA